MVRDYWDVYNLLQNISAHTVSCYGARVSGPDVGSRGWAMNILISKPTLQKLQLPLSLKTAGSLITGIRNVKIVNFHWYSDFLVKGLHGLSLISLVELKVQGSAQNSLHNEGLRFFRASPTSANFRDGTQSVRLDGSMTAQWIRKFGCLMLS